MLYNDQKVNQIVVRSGDTLQLKLCMKASKKEQIIGLALMKSNERVKANAATDSKDKEVKFIHVALGF